MHRAVPRNPAPAYNKFSVLHCQQVWCGRGKVISLRVFALHRGPTVEPGNSTHAIACAAETRCWQCCHRSAEIVDVVAQLPPLAEAREVVEKDLEDRLVLSQRMA